jgi:hypothetical protein
LIVASATVGAITAVTVAPSFAVGLPGTTVGDNCTKYKDISNYPEFIAYSSCTDGSTVKGVSYFEPDGTMFQYLEFRDPQGNLVESRFGRAPASQSSQGIAVAPLADSVSP